MPPLPSPTRSLVVSLSRCVCVCLCALVCVCARLCVCVCLCLCPRSTPCIYANLTQKENRTGGRLRALAASERKIVRRVRVDEIHDKHQQSRRIPVCTRGAVQRGRKALYRAAFTRGNTPICQLYPWVREVPGGWVCGWVAGRGGDGGERRWRGAEAVGGRLGGGWEAVGRRWPGARAHVHGGRLHERGRVIKVGVATGVVDPSVPKDWEQGRL